ncbi:MAG: transporter substrate-binding domain-containing protein, partial [Alphaproteobacteria bacterium]|nr:transporter substrate-binding domain-containing protein [Alphaproteobacteria bacterium]
MTASRLANRLALALVVLIGWASAARAQAIDAQDSEGLRGGWYPWDPYQYLDYGPRVPILTGFDIEIERAIARRLGVQITLPQVAWTEQLAALARGSADIAAGATRTELREDFAYFSKPYRTETDVLVVRAGASEGLPFRTIADMLNTFVKRPFRVGVIWGYVYADPAVNAFIASPANRQLIVPVGNDAQNLENLLAGVIDGFLADHVAATTTAWRRGEGGMIEEHPLRFSTDIHLMLSRKTQTAETLSRLNAAIDDLKRSGEYERIAQVYVLPVLINQTIDQDWFRALGVIGIVAFAVSSVLLAHEGKYTLFGALLFASLPAVGGGVVRDLVLQRYPIAVVRDPSLLLIALATVLVGMLVVRAATALQAASRERYVGAYSALISRAIEVCDAIGLAAFTVTGVVVAMAAGVHPIWLWGPICAVLTSAFGGVLRDLFRHDRVMANLRGELYAEIAAVWGLGFTLFL